MIKVKVTKQERSIDNSYYFRAEKIKSRQNEISRSMETYLLTKKEHDKISYADMVNSFCRHFYFANKIQITKETFLKGKPEGMVFEVKLY